VRQVLILEEAAEDIAAAKDFYEAIDTGLGDYFFDSIMTDLESLGLFHGIHARHFGFQRMLLRAVSRSASTMRTQAMRPVSLHCLISAEIRHGSGMSYQDGHLIPHCEGITANTSETARNSLQPKPQKVSPAPSS
jgi:hypothetical protein